jgi:hypothetical protein
MVYVHPKRSGPGWHADAERGLTITSSGVLTWLASIFSRGTAGRSGVAQIRLKGLKPLHRQFDDKRAPGFG